MFSKTASILILGARGLLGSALVKTLQKQAYLKLLTPTSKQLNLLNQQAIKAYLTQKKPTHLFMVAGVVGGILGNNNAQATFLHHNTLMILNLLETLKELQQEKILSAKTKLLYTGSTCIYPKAAAQPIEEESLLTGPLEETNLGYALAKITGLVACQKYRAQYGLKAITAMPTNLYGIGDNYDLENGHFLAALIKKLVVAKKNNSKTVTFWGSGTPRREALYNLDCAAALVYLMKHYCAPQPINIGTGWDYSIKEYVEKMKALVDYRGQVVWDKSKPDGTFQKKTALTKLKTIYPEFMARSFEAGVKDLLADPAEVKRIHSV